MEVTLENGGVVQRQEQLSIGLGDGKMVSEAKKGTFLITVFPKIRAIMY